MNWYRENRWLGNFLIAFAVSALLAVWFLFRASNALAEGSAEFSQVATERARLEHLNPFPNEENYRKTQASLENYGAALNKSKEDLEKQVIPLPALAPNEFQSRLRQAILSATERARANRVKVPDNFYLGFDEFVTALPNMADAAVLGEELGQIELLVNILIEARVDAITALKRAMASSAEPAASPVGRNATATAPTVVERAIVDLTFTASPTAMQKVLNQTAGSARQFFIVRALQVRNEQQKGPSREQSAPTAAGSASATSPTGALKFIVGNEHVETTAKIELVRFAF